MYSKTYTTLKESRYTKYLFGLNMDLEYLELIQYKTVFTNSNPHFQQVSMTCKNFIKNGALT